MAATSSSPSKAHLDFDAGNDPLSWDHALDVVPGACSFEWDDSGDEGDCTSPADATDKLAALLEAMFLSGDMPATTLCLICWWCHLAGMGGKVARMAYKPDAHSSHYSRHLKEVLGYSDTTDMYVVDCPGHSKHSMVRVKHSIQCLPVHECIHQ